MYYLILDICNIKITNLQNQIFKFYYYFILLNFIVFLWVIKHNLIMIYFYYQLLYFKQQIENSTICFFGNVSSFII